MHVASATTCMLVSKSIPIKSFRRYVSMRRDDAMPKVLLILRRYRTHQQLMKFLTLRIWQTKTGDDQEEKNKIIIMNINIRVEATRRRRRNNDTDRNDEEKITIFDRRSIHRARHVPIVLTSAGMSKCNALEWQRWSLRYSDIYIFHMN